MLDRPLAGVVGRQVRDEHDRAVGDTERVGLEGIGAAAIAIRGQDGRKVTQAFGANPKGIQTFEANGRFTLVFLKSDLPKVASNDRMTPTPEEAMAIAKGAIAYYGTYTVDDLKEAR